MWTEEPGIEIEKEFEAAQATIERKIEETYERRRQRMIEAERARAPKKARWYREVRSPDYKPRKNTREVLRRRIEARLDDPKRAARVANVAKAREARNKKRSPK